MEKIAFINGFVFDSEKESFYKKTIFSVNGIIKDVSRKKVPNDYKIIDLDGKHIIPGLIDVHTHGISKLDFNFADIDGMRKMTHSYAKEGSTSIMPTLASDTYDHLITSMKNINKLMDEGSFCNLVGIHLEGRYLNPVARGAHPLNLLHNPSLDELEEFMKYMKSKPAYISLAPEIEGAEEFIKESVKNGIKISIAHTNATYEEAKHALEIGAISFTHTFNAMTKIHHRMPGCAVCALDSDNAYVELIVDGIHVHPAMVNLVYKMKPSDKLVLITDSILVACAEEGKYGTITVKNGQALNEDGVLAGSTLTMFKALVNFTKFCKVSLSKAIKYATVNPAKMVGAKNIGKIKKGYRCDLIAIDDIKDPHIDTVYVGSKAIV